MLRYHYIIPFLGDAPYNCSLLRPHLDPGLSSIDRRWQVKIGNWQLAVEK